MDANITSIYTHFNGDPKNAMAHFFAVWQVIGAKLMQLANIITDIFGRTAALPQNTRPEVKQRGQDELNPHSQQRS